MRGTGSHITPVIGSVSTADVPHEASTNQNVESVSGKDSVEVDTGVSNYTRVKSRSCQKSEILEKVPNEEHCVGKVLITVINQTSTPTSSEVEEEDESQNRPLRRSSRKSGVKDEQGMKNGDKVLDLGRKRKREDTSKTSRRNSQETKPQEVDSLHADFASCMKRQLIVIIPRLEMKDSTQTVLLNTTTNEEHTTMSPRQPAIEGVNRKRKFSLFETPEKTLTGNIDKQ